MTGRDVVSALALLAGLALVGGGLALAAAIALIVDGVSLQIQGFGLFGSMIVAPLALAVFTVSVAAASSALRRAVVLGVWVPTALMGALLMGVGMAARDDLSTGVLAACLFYGLPVALGAVSLVYNAAVGIPEARQAAHHRRLSQVAEAVVDRGSVTVSDLAAALGVTVDAVVALAAEVRRTGRAEVELDLHRGQLWHRPWADAQCAALRDTVDRDGRVHVAGFASERQVPIDTAREWVYTLVYRRQLTGYISWADGVLYASDAAALRGSSRCPACGGQRELVARGVVGCQHCDAQTLV
ncbi:MAG: hypothetical protein ACI8PZ_004583 [Myxococcota bacterium]